MQKRRGSLLPLLAGVQGFEPQLTDPESAVLPLNDTPSTYLEQLVYYRTLPLMSSPYWQLFIATKKFGS
jgi:hypothetical protein